MGLCVEDPLTRSENTLQEKLRYHSNQQVSSKKPVKNREMEKKAEKHWKGKKRRELNPPKRRGKEEDGGGDRYATSKVWAQGGDNKEKGA